MKYKSVLYLFCMNINTKFLAVYHLGKTHTKDQIDEKIIDLKKKHFVSSIRGDGEFTWAKYSSSSSCDNHNRVVDRVIRTIRDVVGQNYYDVRDPERVKLMVSYYNHTPHNALRMGKMIFTPEEVERNKDLEGLFIRKNKEILEVEQERQRKEKLFKYKTGNVIMVHLNFSRTPYRFLKIRRKFNALAIFQRYHHGNVLCTVFKSGLDKYEKNILEYKTDLGVENEEDATDVSIKLSTEKNEITVPIYYTKFVSFRNLYYFQKFFTFFFLFLKIRDGKIKEIREHRRSQNCSERTNKKIKSEGPSRKERI
jgi:hypothetical protein